MSFQLLLCIPSGVSLLVCSASVFHLMKQRQLFRYYLFWHQLLWLLSSSALCEAIRICWILLPYFGASSGITAFSSLYQCLMGAFDFWSCTLELNIALGFAAAAFGNVRVGYIIKKTLPGSVIFAALLAYARSIVETRLFGGCAQSWSMCHAVSWSMFVVPICAMTALAYFIAFFRLLKAPTSLRKRVVTRMCWFLGCFMLTYLPFATCAIILWQENGDIVVVKIALFVETLSAALDAVVYMLLFQKMHQSRPDPKNAEEDSRDVLCAREEFMIAQYFDFSTCFSSVTLTAVQDTTRAVAALEDLRSTPNFNG